MTTTELTPASETSSSSGIPAARSYLPGRRDLIAAGAVIVAAGLAFKWSWLVAAGITPVLLSVLPCVAMCALGLCMNRIVGGSSGRQQSATQPGVSTDDELVAARLAAPASGDKSCCQSVR